MVNFTEGKEINISEEMEMENVRNEKRNSCRIEKSKIQKVIEKEIQKFIKEENAFNKVCGSKENAEQSILYYFHDNKSIAVDGALYEILAGTSEFNYGSRLKENIYKELEKRDYYLEYEGSGVYNIVKQ